MIKQNLVKAFKNLNDSLATISATSLKSYANAAKNMPYDNDPFSYFKITNGANFIGLDFGKPINVKKIKFLAENDDNHINEGQNYELLYWKDNAWQSLGIQIGSSEHELVYDNAPANALFLVINRTKGTEHRIFTYGNNQQIWW